MRKIAYALIIAGAVVLVLLTFSNRGNTSYLRNARRFLASVFFTDSVTVQGLKDAYANAGRGGGKVKILIAPGHDDDSWGTEFRGVREADMTAELGEKLAAFLARDKEFEVTLLRDSKGYNPAFLDYFVSRQDAIRAFVKKQKTATKDVITSGELHTLSDGVIHNTAAADVALKLYGVNKWANDNGMNIVIHIHFNDYPGRKANLPGKYSGFSIYVPENQFSNAKASQAVAEEVFRQMAKYYPMSDLPKEEAGAIEDQDLIAIGANNSLDAAGVLIEYGYIYEPMFVNKSVRDKVLGDLALQTYLGLARFFGDEKKLSAREYETSFLPFRWDDVLRRGTKQSEEVVSLQAALAVENLFPPEGFDKRNCPLAGNFGDCTRLALTKFQKKHSLASESGYVGQATLNKLNELFSK
ncbi:MAG: N-acetylmuramoyl-L-alanine amidase [Parcubacteria group bacterium]|nr:N-acetylmuramoyl-L-alanine amidase [Parcubacteria group bacterium]